MLARQHGFKAFLDQTLARPRHRGETDVKRLHDAAVAPTLSRRPSPIRKAGNDRRGVPIESDR